MLKIKKTKILSIGLLFIVIIWWSLHTPFSSMKLHRAIPKNTVIYCEFEHPTKAVDRIVKSHPTKYLVNSTNKKLLEEIKNSQLYYWTEKLTGKMAVGYSAYTGLKGEPCTYAIVEIGKAQNILKLILSVKKFNIISKSEKINEHTIRTISYKGKNIFFALKNGMILITIAESSNPLEQILKQLSEKSDPSDITISSLEKLSKINRPIKGFIRPDGKNTKLSKSLIFSCEKLSSDFTEIRMYSNDNIGSFPSITDNEIESMLTTLNYYPTCFLATTPEFIQKIVENYIELPSSAKNILSSIKNSSLFLSSASWKYSGKTLKLKTPSIVTGAMLSSPQQEKLIASILQNITIENSKLFIDHSKTSKINIINTYNPKTKFAQQPPADLPAFTTKDNITLFCSDYSVLKRIISRPSLNLYKNAILPKQSLAFFIMDMSAMPNLIKDYMSIYAIYLIISSDKHTASKRSYMDQIIAPLLDKYKLPGSLSISIEESILSPYQISIKISEHK